MFNGEHSKIAAFIYFYNVIFKFWDTHIMDLITFILLPQLSNTILALLHPWFSPQSSISLFLTFCSLSSISVSLFFLSLSFSFPLLSLYLSPPPLFSSLLKLIKFSHPIFIDKLFLKYGQYVIKENWLSISLSEEQ